MSRATDAQQFFADVEGERVTCVENTYIPSRNGLILRLNRVGKSVADATAVNTRGSVEAGYSGYRINLPTRVRDVVALNDHTVTYKIGVDDHTVTYRKGDHPL